MEVKDGSRVPVEPLSAARKELIRRTELERLRSHSQKLRGRNIGTGLVIGAFVIGVFGYTIYSVSQERIMDQLDEEAKFAISRGPRTGAN